MNLYLNLYLNLKKKYINYKKNLIGGSYLIESHGTLLLENNICIYPELSILLEDDIIGSGGSGSVNLGTIIECSINPILINKTVAIKTFKDPKNKISEKEMLKKFTLDVDNELLEISFIPTLYFDIISGPLKDKLVYEYGGNTLNTYFDSENCNIKNNIHIMLQLFTVLYNLAKNHDNMQNDIKNLNITYNINRDEININLIDFGSSRSINKLNNKDDNFKRRTNMNTPETIYNFLTNNNRLDLFLETTTENETNIDEKYNNYNRWYYYPFISIVCYIFTGNEYSSGKAGTLFIENLIDKTKILDESGNFQMTLWKTEALNVLLNNDNVIRFLTEHLPEKFQPYLESILKPIINMICKPIPNERASEEEIISFLTQLLQYL